jgi:hypothetical protein
MLTDQELQTLRNLGNESEAAAEEILRLRATLAASCDEHRSEIYDAGPGGGCILLADAVAAERERWLAVSDAQRERNNAAQVRDAALAALFEVDRLAGHDDAMTEWREKWAHLWALRDGPTAPGPAPGCASSAA